MPRILKILRNMKLMKTQLLATKIKLDLMIIIMRSLLNTIPNQKPRNLKMVILLMSRKSLMMQMQKPDSIQKKILRKMSPRTKRLLRNLMMPKRQSLKVQKMSQKQMKKQIWMTKGMIKKRRTQRS